MSNYDPNYIPQKNYFLVGQKCIVVNQEDKILLLKRSEKAGEGGKWNLLGGGLEHNEDPIEGIKREAQEETQIEIYNIQPIKIVSFDEKNNQVLMIGYKAKTNQSDVTLNWEHDDYCWLSKEEALKMNISEIIKDFIRSS